MKKVIFILFFYVTSAFALLVTFGDKNVVCQGYAYSNNLPFPYNSSDGNKYPTTTYLGEHNNAKWYSKAGINQAYSDCDFSNYCTTPQIFQQSTLTCECPPTDFNIIIDELTTSETCTVIQANMLLPDGGVNYISSVEWDSCRNECRGKASSCPCNQHIFNGACVDVVPTDGSCQPGYIFKNECSISDGGSSNTGSCPGCIVSFFNSGSLIACYAASSGCCTGNTATNDGDGDGQPDTNTTNPDTNTTNPGDPVEDGGEDGGETGGETGGTDSNTSTPAPGDSNTSTPAPGDSNTSASYEEYEDSDADKDGKGKIGQALDDAYSTLDKIKSDYERIMNALENGVAPISVSSGSVPQFCATIFGKQICINLCDSFGYFYSVFYYMFLILFTVMALRIYYTAFKMR